MKVKQVRSKWTVTFDDDDEAASFAHLFGCENQAHCMRRAKVEQLKKRFQNILFIICNFPV